MKRYCLALDLKNDPALIAGYVKHHENGWPENLKAIKDAGIEVMDIYLTGNRLFMIMETKDDFSFEEKSKSDALNKKVQEWEELMWRYQLPLPHAKPGEKWMVMDKIFEL
ncbi:MAG: L-rhamnose mutarotase [Bacteroidia bacterium]|nr:L-rhamnose mutarotase [Bacteroidia bacterium]